MKKIILVTGDKGGVGKSFTARIIADYLLDKKVSFRAFDTDKTNATFYRFYPDFVVWLKDGRVALVEHKGRVEQAVDVADKKNAGDFWAMQTGGLFVMTEDDHKGNVDFSELRQRLA